MKKNKVIASNHTGWYIVEVNYSSAWMPMYRAIARFNRHEDAVARLFRMFYEVKFNENVEWITRDRFSYIDCPLERFVVYLD